MLISVLPGQLQVQDDGIDTEKLTPSPDTSASAPDLIPKVDEETIAGIIHVYVFVCVCVNVPVCVHVSYVCMYLYMYICVNIYLSTCMYM